MRRVYLKGQFNNNFSSKAHAENIFFKHIEEVISYVPKEQLLVYDVSEGWEPLCRFLEIPIPNQAFPHLNKKEHFHEMVKGMIREASKKS